MPERRCLKGSSPGLEQKPRRQARLPSTPACYEQRVKATLPPIGSIAQARRGSCGRAWLFSLVAALVSCKGEADIAAVARSSPEPELLELEGDVVTSDPSAVYDAGRYWVFATGSHLPI